MSSFNFQHIVCPTCNVDDADVLGRRGGAAHRSGAGTLCTIVRCRRCGLLYPNPFPFPDDLDSLYSDTEGYFCAHPDFGTKTDSREQLIAAIEQLTPGRCLLDVGAGLGETVAAALRRGWDAYGIEAAQRFAAHAAEQCPGRIVCTQLDRAPKEILSRSYDAIVLAAVLEHLHEPSNTLATVSTLLKPGGILFLDVPNESGLYFRLGNLWNRIQRRDWVMNLSPTFSPYHVFGFNRQSLTRILHKNDLEPEVLTFYPGASLLPFQWSVRGAAEWLASHAVHVASQLAEQGNYIACYARKREPKASPSM